MTGPMRCERLLLALLGGIAAFAAVAHLLLLLHLRVPSALLPAALALGLVAAWRARAAPTGGSAPTPRWLPWAVLGLLGVVTAAVTYGALATPSRHWDGAVAWDTKARYLTLDPTLQQPFFADPAVFAPARDYPLLQPLLIAAGNGLLGGQAGRLLFPLVLVLLALLVGTTLRRATGSATITWLGTGALLLTPLLVSPTSGGIDSGYGDAFLLLCTTTMAAGLLLRDGRLLFLGAMLAVLVKPEGLVHAGAAIAVALCVGERALLRSAAAGLVLGGQLWLPLQYGLQNGGEAPTLPFAIGLLLFWAAIEGADATARRWGLGTRGRLVAAAVLLPVVGVAAPLLAAWSGGASGTMHAYLHDLERPLQRLDRLPAILMAVGQYGLLRGGFGLAFWLPCLAVTAAWRNDALRPLTPLLAFLVAGLLITLAPFLLSPEADLAHHLRSSMPRLLLHWLGAATLLGCAAISAAATPGGDRR